MNVLSLFDGISCGKLALDRAGVTYDNYFSSEIDQFALQISSKNHTDIQQIGDVLNIQAEYLPQIDLLMGGSPCQGFSMAGKRLAFDDPRSALFFEFVKIFTAKGLYYFVLYASLFFLFYKVIFPYYHLDFKGSEFLHFLLSSIFIIAVMVYTTFLGTFFKSAIGWTEIMAFSTYPLFLVSGYSWPIEAMPNALQVVANLLPSTPYFTVFNKLAAQGATLVNIKSEVIHLLLLLLLGYLLLYLLHFLLRLNLLLIYRF